MFFPPLKSKFHVFKKIPTNYWGILRKIAAVKVEQSIVQLWRLVFLEPLGVQWPYVPHFKGLISAKVDLEAQGRDSTFTFCHAHLKKAILHLRTCNEWFVFSTTVCVILLEFLIVPVLSRKFIAFMGYLSVVLYL